MSFAEWLARGELVQKYTRRGARVRVSGFPYRWRTNKDRLYEWAAMVLVAALMVLGVIAPILYHAATQ